MTFEPVYRERKDFPTPAGGAYVVADYLDADMQPIDKRRATRVRVVEYAADGSVVHTTVATMSPSEPLPPSAGTDC